MKEKIEITREQLEALMFGRDGVCIKSFNDVKNDPRVEMLVKMNPEHAAVFANGVKETTQTFNRNLHSIVEKLFEGE